MTKKKTTPTGTTSTPEPKGKKAAMSPETARPKKRKTPLKTKGGQGRKPEDKLIQLAPEQQKFQDLIRECTVEERKFVLALLEGHNKTQAGIRAGWAESSADVTAARALGRARVKNALEAGYEAAGISPARTLAFIAALANFDRSQIETVVRQRTLDHVERSAAEVAEETRREIEIVRSAVEDLKIEEADEAELKPLQMRLSRLRLRLMDLEIALDRDPGTLTIVEVERLEEIPLIDLKKARDLGLSRFIKGVKRTKYGFEIETHDFLDGVDRAAKVHGLYKDSLTVANPDGTPLEQVRQAGPSDLATLLAAYDQLRQGTG